MIFERLENELILLQPMEVADFEALFAVAADKEIWAQHPKFDRYKLEEFSVYFKSLINSDQPYLIINKADREIIGSTCFYEFSEEKNSVAIGYTFLAKKYWGGIYNKQIKQLMLRLAFEKVDQVIFYVRKGNLRSQKALEKIGAILFKEYPEPNSPDGIRLEYSILKKDFINI